MSEQDTAAYRDFSSISPSARMLLMLKGYLNIPFARQAAELASLPERYIPDYTITDSTFWARMVHFEKRYWSIDQLLDELPVKNILEISSGFSFRGLEKVNQPGIHYIDTDLPELIEIKKNFLKAFDHGYDSNSELETLPLNALDEHAFNKIVDHFISGEIAIVNEGLLMYLDMPEKERLCQVIHKILQQRGGYWITADIYVKKPFEELHLQLDEKMKAFLEEHKVEENKFDSFEAAEAFFIKMGFVIDKVAEADRSKLTALQYLVKSLPEDKLAAMRSNPKIQETWRLKAV